MLARRTPVSASTVLLLVLIILGISPMHPPRAVAQSATVRSALYPLDWKPLDRGGSATSDGKFLHDFSYAGYRGDETSASARTIPSSVGPHIINVVTDARFGADNTAATDTTPQLQAAIDYVCANGGGTVELPAGSYRVRPQPNAGDPSGTNSYALRIGCSNLILRGAGSTGTTITKIFNDQTVMRGKKVIAVGAGDDENVWYTTQTTTPVPLSADQLEPTRTLALADVSGFAVGDWIVVRADVTPAFRSAHGMDPGENGCPADIGCWPQEITGGAGARGLLFYRRVKAINSATNTLTIDIPTRYELKPGPGTDGDDGNNARVYKTAAAIANVGIEDLAIGMKQNTNTTGVGDNDYTTPGTGAYEMSGSGNVLLRNTSTNPRLEDDFHRYLSPANLIDNHTLHGALLKANNRGDKSNGGGHTSTQSVFWNTTATSFWGGKTYGIHSAQYGWGYVIGTRGDAADASTEVYVPVEGGTGPADYREHIGLASGTTLVPESLYDDQLYERQHNWPTTR